MSEASEDTGPATKHRLFLWFAFYSSLFRIVVDTASEDVPNMCWDTPWC